MKRTLTLLLLIASVACYAQKAKLELNLKLDSTYYLNHHANMTITETIQGQSQVMNMIIDGTVSHKITAIKDSIYEMDARYERMNISVEMGGKRIMEVNTDIDGQDIMSKLMKGMLHKPIKIAINKTGKVLSVKNLDTIYTGMFSNMPPVSEEKKAQFKAQMDKSFGEKAFKTNFQDAFTVLPSNAVGINDTWLSTLNIEAIAIAQVKTTYLMKGITNSAYIIDGNASISSTGTADYTQMNGIAMRFNNLSGTYKAEYKLDKASGWITYAKLTRSLEGDVQVKDSASVPGGMTFPIKMIGDVTITNK